jgi:hypothetical protein
MLPHSYKEVFQSCAAIFNNITDLNKGTAHSNCTVLPVSKLTVTEAMCVCGVVLLELPILCFLLHYLQLPLVYINKSKLLATRAGYQMLHKYQNRCEQNEYTTGEQVEEQWRGKCVSLKM